MSSFGTKVLYGALLAGGLTLVGATAANAADTSGEDSTLGGSQVAPSISVPVDLDGIAVSLFGDSSASASHAEPTATTASPPAANTAGSGSVGGGTQVIPDFDLPIDVGGLAVSLFGDADATARDTDAAHADAPQSEIVTSGEDSILGGSQVAGAIHAPIDLGGIAIAPFGDTTAHDATAVQQTPSSDPAASAAATTGEDGIGAGTQVAPSADVPITLGGIAVSLTGDSSATSSGSGASDNNPAGPEATTDGGDSTLGGTQVAPVISLPISIGGIAVSLTGDADTDMPGGGTAPSETETPGDDDGAPVDVTPGMDPITGNAPHAGSTTVANTGTVAIDESRLASTGNGGLAFGAIALALLAAGFCLVGARRHATR